MHCKDFCILLYQKYGRIPLQQTLNLLSSISQNGSISFAGKQYKYQDVQKGLTILYDATKKRKNIKFERPNTLRESLEAMKNLNIISPKKNHDTNLKIYLNGTQELDDFTPSKKDYPLLGVHEICQKLTYPLEDIPTTMIHELCIQVPLPIFYNYNELYNNIFIADILGNVIELIILKENPTHDEIKELAFEQIRTFRLFGQKALPSNWVNDFIFQKVKELGTRCRELLIHICSLDSLTSQYSIESKDMTHPCIIGKMDLVNIQENIIIEVKCTKSITRKHKYQLLIYATLWYKKYNIIPNCFIVNPVLGVVMKLNLPDLNLFFDQLQNNTKLFSIT